MTNKLIPFFGYRFAIALTFMCMGFNLNAQTYCTSKGNLPWTEWIAGVKFGTINNASSKEGYGNFTSQTTNLTIGTSYPLSITQGFSYAPDAANATQQGRVWIDYNKNGTFEATELVASLTRTTTTANVVIPTTASTGATRMRVSFKTTGAPTACEVFDKGEVEDYTVNISGGTVQSCANNALNFDGVNDLVVSSRTVIPANADFTLEASCISTATSTGCGGAFRRLLVFDLSSSLNRFEIGDCAGSLTLYYYFGGVDELVNIPNTNTLRNGAWHHVSVVKQGTNLMIYYDGSLVLTRPNMGGVNPVARQLIVGSWVQPIENWAGSIDEVKVWNYAMTASEVQSKRLCSPTGTESNLLLYYPFNQGASSGDNTAITTVLDKSLSANNGQIRNFALTGATSNFVCSTLALTPCATVNNSCSTQDSLQLVSLYNATGGANWTNKWNLATPINTWYGIALNAEGCVIVIELISNNLVGTIPNLNMPNLEKFRLSNNRLSGTIPNFTLPKLKYLDFAGNNLTGSIPNFNLPNLLNLLISYNQLTGSIPNFNLPNLEFFTANENLLSGTVPNFNVTNYPKLKSIFLSGNQLSGTIPNFNLPNLFLLTLGNNQLSGSIPNFNGLPILSNLQLERNRLTGSIPSFNLPMLGALTLNNNQLSGCLPIALQSLCGNSVDISNNPSLATQDFAAFCANNTGWDFSNP